MHRVNQVSELRDVARTEARQRGQGADVGSSSWLALKPERLRSVRYAPGQHADVESGVKVTVPDISSPATVTSPFSRPSHRPKLSTSPVTVPTMSPFQY